MSSARVVDGLRECVLHEAFVAEVDQHPLRGLDGSFEKCYLKEESRITIKSQTLPGIHPL